MQPPESNQLAAVNSRQTLQGTDMDIKELATLTAAEMDDIYLRNVPANILEQYATRLIAAYTEEQEPVSLYPCGFKELRSLVIKSGAYLARGMDEGEPVTESIRSAAMVLVGYAKDMSDLLARQPLFTAPPEPAPQQEPLHVGDSQFESWFSTYWSASLRNGSKQIARDAYAAGMGDPLVAPAACAAPSSEEVKRIVGDTFEASMSYQSGEIGPITLRQENAIRVVVWDSVNAVLAARVPDGCVVVPIADLKNAAGSYEEGDGQSCVQILNRLIAAGEVKP